MKTTIPIVLIVITALSGCVRPSSDRPASAEIKPAAYNPANVSSTQALAKPAAMRGPHWVKVDDTAVAGMTAYVDTASLISDGPYRKIWSIYDYSVQQAQRAGFNHRSVKGLQLYSCRDKKQSFEEVSFYKENMGSGESVLTRKVYDLKWLPVPAGSMAETMMNIACR